MGVGIAGEEGLQAVNSSDYAIAQVCVLGWLVLRMLMQFSLVPVLETPTFRPRALVLRA